MIDRTSQLPSAYLSDDKLLLFAVRRSLPAAIRLEDSTANRSSLDVVVRLEHSQSRTYRLVSLPTGYGLHDPT